MKAKRDNCRRVKTEWRINIYRERASMRGREGTATG